MKSKINLILILSLFTTFYVGCKQEFVYKSSPNAVKTLEVENVLQTSATIAGQINTDNGSSVSERGVCYSQSPTPTISDLRKIDARQGIGNFSCDLQELLPNTKYFARAYATNSYGTAYGNEVNFTTKEAVIPILNSTTNPNSINQVAAKSGGEITNSGASPVTARGVCWSSLNQIPTLADSKTNDGIGIGVFSSTLSNLIPNTKYFVRSYATNSIGTAYGDVKSFSTTVSVIPTASSVFPPTLITLTTATSGGIISGDGGAAVISRGVCWSNATSNPTIANAKTIDGIGIGNFTSELTGLSPNTTYYIRAYATNSNGTAYSNITTFKTVSASLPSIISTAPFSVTANSANSGGNVVADGGANVTSRGVCWSNTTSSPSINNSTTYNGSGIGSFTSSLTGLTASTTYYLRAFATNSIGTSYGSVFSLTTIGEQLIIGQPYQGGALAYIFQPGDVGYINGQTHGLIATLINVSSGSQWGCAGTLISSNGLTIGSGLANSQAIQSKCNSSSSAAYVCLNYSSGGYSDWYLPSRDELYKLYLNRIAIKNFPSYNYWSSSEVTSNTAWCIDFSSGSQVSGYSKSNSFYIRPIRKF